MFDRNAVNLIGTIVNEPVFKKTENKGKSKVDFAIQIHRSATNTSYDRIYVTVWEDLADYVYETFHKNDRISVQGKIKVNTYKGADGYHSFTRIVAEEIDVPSDEETEGYGYIPVQSEMEEMHA